MFLLYNKCVPRLHLSEVPLIILVNDKPFLSPSYIKCLFFIFYKMSRVTQIQSFVTLPKKEYIVHVTGIITELQPSRCIFISHIKSVP